MRAGRVDFSKRFLGLRIAIRGMNREPKGRIMRVCMKGPRARRRAPGGRLITFRGASRLGTKRGRIVRVGVPGGRVRICSSGRSTCVLRGKRCRMFMKGYIGTPGYKRFRIRGRRVLGGMGDYVGYPIRFGILSRGSESDFPGKGLSKIGRKVRRFAPVKREESCPTAFAREGRGRGIAFRRIHRSLSGTRTFMTRLAMRRVTELTIYTSTK